MIDLSKCECIEPGFCPIFNRHMGVDPPDWKWCQDTNTKERQHYYDLLSQAPPTKNKKLMELFNDFNCEKKWLFLYYLTLNEKYFKCKKASNNQKKKNKLITQYIESQNKTDIDFDKIEILCLGHSDKQFNNILDQPYITKTNLNEINAGKYSGNEWSESRAFISETSLFKDDKEFYGFVTASWNNKYESYSLIDNFYNWNHSRILLRSKPEDKIVLCADVFCPCYWIYGSEGNNGILSGLYGKYAKKIGREFLKLLGLYRMYNFKHVKVPYGNQIIAHKNIIKSYQDFLNSQDVFEKIEWTVNKNQKYVRQEDNDLISNKYQNSRIQAYLLEMTTCFWFSHQDYLYIPNTIRKEEWYTRANIKNRIVNWQS